MKQNRKVEFFSKWLRSPATVASVTPSSPHLARAMATALPDCDGLVVELGGGTGPITRALLAHGVAPARLVVIERDHFFCRHLQEIFPGSTVLQGDALHLRSLLHDLASHHPVCAVVSGLPLLNMGDHMQRELVGQSMELIDGRGPFVQFSYGMFSPLKRKVSDDLQLHSRCVAQVWRNIPPAKVWTYTQSRLPLQASGGRKSQEPG